MSLGCHLAVTVTIITIMLAKLRAGMKCNYLIDKTLTLHSYKMRKTHCSSTTQEALNVFSLKVSIHGLNFMIYFSVKYAGMEPGQ